MTIPWLLCGFALNTVEGVEWQGKWAMPSYRQLKGLGDLQRERITINDVSGMKITASNGNKIFLP